MKGKCIVIGAGDLTVRELIPGEEDYVIAADGGLRYCSKLGIEPDKVIGDFDSVSTEEREMISLLKEKDPGKILKLPVEKDDTDMLAALKTGLELGYRDFRIYAGTGGRFDHTLANIQCLLYLKSHGAAGYLMDENGMILVIQKETVCFPQDLKGTLSLFSLGKEATGVTIQGMKYTLKDSTITNDYPIGISNEFIGEEASISVANGELVCILEKSIPKASKSHYGMPS